MQNTQTGAGQAMASASLDNNTEIFEGLDIALDDIPERPGITTILKRPGGRIIRHAANAGGPGNANRLPGTEAAGNAITSATQTVSKTITEHPVASMAVVFAIGYLIGRKRR